MAVKGVQVAAEFRRKNYRGRYYVTSGLVGCRRFGARDPPEHAAASRRVASTTRGSLWSKRLLIDVFIRLAIIPLKLSTNHFVGLVTLNSLRTMSGP